MLKQVAAFLKWFFTPLSQDKQDAFLGEHPRYPEADTRAAARDNRDLTFRLKPELSLIKNSASFGSTTGNA